MVSYKTFFVCIVLIFQGLGRALHLCGMITQSFIQLTFFSSFFHTLLPYTPHTPPRNWTRYWGNIRLIGILSSSIDWSSINTPSIRGVDRDMCQWRNHNVRGHAGPDGPPGGTARGYRRTILRGSNADGPTRRAESFQLR